MKLHRILFLSLVFFLGCGDEDESPKPQPVLNETNMHNAFLHQPWLACLKLAAEVYSGSSKVASTTTLTKRH